MIPFRPDEIKSHLTRTKFLQTEKRLLEKLRASNPAYWIAYINFSIRTKVAPEPKRLGGFSKI
uniref:Uncharacterized protein n=1 Tax=Romanomermis culicivorax TaxID=13658 RepID=A0A915HL07_ROMCU